MARIKNTLAPRPAYRNRNPIHISHISGSPHLQLTKSVSKTVIKANIQRALEKLHRQPEDKFAFTESFLISPSPGLDVIGLLALPLNERVSSLLVTLCDKAQGFEPTGDIWSLDRSKMTLDPLWDTWLQSTVVPKICEELEVSHCTKPVAQLRELLIQFAGSRVLMHKQELTPASAIQIAVSLPSNFVGGSIRLSCCGQTKLQDADDPGLVSVTAWRHDVQHAIDPIESGLRLSLVYDLVLSDTSHSEEGHPLGQHAEPTNNLQQAFENWFERKAEPMQLIYMLDQQYVRENLRLGDMKGVDVKLLNTIQPIMDDLNVDVYLIEIEAERVFGSGCCDQLHRDFEYKVTYSADLSGIPVIFRSLNLRVPRAEEGLCSGHLSTGPGSGSELPESDWEDSVINPSLDECLPDETLWEQDIKSQGVTRIHKYRRNAVMMRSRSQEHPVCIDISALKSLEVQPSSWDDPTTKPLDGVVKSFIERCGRYVGASRQSSEILRIIALRWGASELWNRATMLIGTRETLEAITIGGAMSALRAFGLNAIQPGLQYALRSHSGNRLKLGVLDEISLSSRPEDKLLPRWCMEQLNDLPHHLGSLVAEDIPYLLAVAAEQGARFMLEIVCPQIEALSLGKMFLTGFVLNLVEDNEPLSTSDVTIWRVVDRLLVATAKSLDRRLSDDDITFLITVAKLRGIEFVHESLMPNIALDDGSILPLIRALHEARNDIQPDTAAVCSVISQQLDNAVQLLLPSIEIQTHAIIHNTVSKYADLCLATDNPNLFSKLVHSMIIALNAATPSRDMYQVAEYCYVPLVKDFLRLYKDERHPSFIDTVSDLVEVAAGLVQESPYRQAENERYHYRDCAGVQLIEAIIQLCLLTNNHQSCLDLLSAMAAEFNQMDAAERTAKAKQFYLPLLVNINGADQPDRSNDAVAPLVIAATEMFYEYILPSMTEYRTEHVEKVILSVFKGPAEPLQNLDQLKKLLSSAELPAMTFIKCVTLILAENKQTILESGFDAATLEAVIRLFCTTFVDSMTIELQNPISAPLERLKLCLKAASTEPMERLFQRLLTPPTDVLDADWIHLALMQFTFKLVELLKLHNLDITVAPFVGFCRTVMKEFIIKVLPNPAVLPCELGQLNCACSALRPILSSPSLTGTSEKLTGPQIMHIAKCMRLNFKGWGVSYQTSAGNVMRFTKPVDFVTKVKKRTLDDGREVLNKLGNEAQQRIIFGADYLIIMASMAVVDSNQNNAPQNSRKRGYDGHQLEDREGKHSRQR